MDNLSELNPQPDKPEIPEHWQLEKREPSPSVIQIDLEEKYLALRRTFTNPEQVLTTDYFFDREGLPIMVRSYDEYTEGKYSVYIKERGEIQIESFFSHHKPIAMYVSFYDPEETSMSLNVFRANPMDGIFFGRDGRPKIVRMARPWLKNNPNPPGIDFSNEQDELIKKNWDCCKVFDLSGFRILDQGQPNKLVFVNKEGKKEYVVVWDTVTEEDREGNKVPFFVVTQSHIEEEEEKEVKILKSPIQINMEEVREVLLSKPPYSRDEKGRLVVPWRGIPRIVGASLSYSYPPQNLARETS